MNKLLFSFLIITTLLCSLALARGGGGHSGGTVHVNGYTRKDGTTVSEYDRSSPGSGSSYSGDYSSSPNNGKSGTSGTPDSSSHTPGSQMYSWEDEKGGIHATNDRKDVPQHVLEKSGSIPNETAPRSVPTSPQAAPVIKTDTLLNSPAKISKTGKADNYYDKTGTLRDGKTGRIHRSAVAKKNFRVLHPCPSTGKTEGACSGYVIDHIVPLKRGGKDLPSNMQWQTVQDAKAKDKWE